jgi:Kef-type K+ transport system membrane component KefB
VEHGLLSDIALCTFAAWVAGVAFNALRQPLILAYLLAGFALGPNGFGWVHGEESIATISNIGLILLLFMIGLEMDLHDVLQSSRSVLTVAACQILGGTALGWVFFHILGPVAGNLEALYLGVAAALSSTVIIVKILYDRGELSTLTGRLTLGVLVLQDLFAILFLAIQPNLQHPTPAIFALSAGRVIVLISVAFLASRYLLPRVFRSVARLPELVLVGALAWCLALAGLAHRLDLSREMGALVAGVALSTFPYTLEVVAKVTSIRDFFVTLFFVALGMQIPVPTWHFATGAALLAAFLVFSRILTTFPPLHALRFGHRGSLLPTLNLCQMSELSLVILTLGQKTGDVSQNTLSVAAFAFAFLAVASTYGLAHGGTLVRIASPFLTRLGLRDLGAQPSGPTRTTPEPRIFLLGFHWAASSLLDEIRRHRPALLPQLRVVDFSPRVYDSLRTLGVDVVYGDLSHRDVLVHAGLTHAHTVICSLPDTLLKGLTNLRLLRQVRELNPTARIIVHAEHVAAIPTLYAAGASHVLASRLLEASELLQALDAVEKNLLDQKRKDLESALADRQEVLP